MVPDEVIDQVRVLWRLRNASHDLAVLDAEAAADGARRADPIWLRGVPYAFVTAVGSCLDVAEHLCAVEGWGPPPDGASAIGLLGEHDAVPEPVATSMAEAVTLREALLGQDVDVDETVLERILDIDNLGSFIAAIAEFVERRYV